MVDGNVFFSSARDRKKCRVKEQASSGVHHCSNAVGTINLNASRMPTNYSGTEKSHSIESRRAVNHASLSKNTKTRSAAQLQNVQGNAEPLRPGTLVLLLLASRTTNNTPVLLRVTR